VKPDVATISIHDYSWHKLGWMVFIDQPLGTGLSRVNKHECSWCDYVHNQSAVNSHMYSTLQSLVRIHPYLQDRPIYFTGESYAGHYIPSMADYIIEANKFAEVRGDFVLDVQGLALGNGWTDPEVQYNFGEFAHNMGLITFQEQAALENQYKACLKQEEKGDYSGAKACNILNSILASSGVCPSRETAADDDFDDTTGKSKNQNNGACYGPIVNYYDVRSYYNDPGVDWPENSIITEKYLSRVDVQDAVHVNRYLYPSITFKECNHAGHNLMKLDGMGVVREVIRVLDTHKIPMLFYNGQFDLICNHLGTETLLNNLEWNGQDDFVNAPGGIWAVKNQKGELVPAGYSRATSNGLLTFLMVIGGSHMVPMDVPEASLDMIYRFLHKQSFLDGKQPYPAKTKKGHWNEMQAKANNTRDDNVKSSILYLLLTLGVVSSVIMILSVLRSFHPTSSDKYHPIRTINHLEGEDFTIYRNVEMQPTSNPSSGAYNESPIERDLYHEVGLEQPYQPHSVHSGRTRYRAIVP
jgi:carboxypeptidase D